MLSDMIKYRDAIASNKYRDAIASKNWSKRYSIAEFGILESKYYLKCKLFWTFGEIQFVQ